MLEENKMKKSGLARAIVAGAAQTAAALLAFYFFVVSLTFLSTSFRLLGGKNIASLFTDNDLLANPIVGVMIGILVTVLVQSSATSTSIIVSLVSSGAADVRTAVPMIFGSNIGTSVTNTIVSMTQAADKERFRRAFAAATVHDMFNWLTVVTLLFFEMATGALEALTGSMVDAMNLGESGGDVTNPDLLKPLTKPLTDLVVRVNKSVIIGWSLNDSSYADVTTVLKMRCGEEPCRHLAALLGGNGLGWSDTVVGVLLLAFSLAMLCGCLLALMKALMSVMGSNMAKLIENVINADIPYCPWLTGYLAMLIGAVVTVLVRSSSVFTSTLTPLCGAGLVKLETAYPMTLGSNIGTTTTAILASLAAEGRYLRDSVQIALVHLFFNVVGILIFYPLPFMRWPIPLANALGDKTATYRWFAALYLVATFFVLPMAVFLLSLAGMTVMYAALGSSLIALAVISGVTFMQGRRPGLLPPFLRSWNFLPECLRSLEPYDRIFRKVSLCSKCYEAEEGDNCGGVAEARGPELERLCENGNYVAEKKDEVIGHANGNGYAHIYANGYANGHANGHTNGYANGHANGHAIADGDLALA